MTDLGGWQVFLEVGSKGFVLSPGGLVDSSRRYLCIRVSERDFVVLGFVFRKSSSLSSGKAWYVTRVSFACVNDQ